MIRQRVVAARTSANRWSRDNELTPADISLIAAVSSRGFGRGIPGRGNRT